MDSTDWLYMYGANGSTGHSAKRHYNFGKVKIYLDLFGIVDDVTFRQKFLGEKEQGDNQY